MSGQLGSRLQGGVHGSDVHAGQGEPGQRKLPPGAVVLELDVEVEVSGVEEQQGAGPQRALFGLHLTDRQTDRIHLGPLL